MNPASLPAGSAQHPSDGLFQSFVGIANDQSHVAQAPAYQVAQKLGPEGTVLRQAHIQAEDLTITRARNAYGYHQSHAENMSALPHLDVFSVHPQIRVAIGQRAMTECLHQ